MENEEETVYLEDVEKPVLNCPNADIDALDIDEKTFGNTINNPQKPLFLIYPLIDSDLEVTGFKAKLEIPLK